MDFSKYLSPTLNVRPQDFEEDVEVVGDVQITYKNQLRSASVSKPINTTKFVNVMKDRPARHEGKYGYVNLDNSDMSSLSRTSSTSKYKLNKSTNRL